MAIPIDPAELQAAAAIRWAARYQVAIMALRAILREETKTNHETCKSIAKSVLIVIGEEDHKEWS